MFAHYIDLGWRSFKRTPLISILMVLAIAVGIGITMTSLSVYHMMAMDPIPHKSDKLHHPQLNTLDDGRNWNTPDDLPYQLTYQDVQNLANAPVPALKTPSFRTGFSVHMNSPDVKPFVESARVVNRDFFDMFELQFIYGGPWSQTEQRDASPVVIISSEVNERLFAGQNSVGKQIYLDDTSYRVSGVIANWDIHTKYYDLNNGAFNDPENLFIPFSLTAVKELASWGNNNGWKRENIDTFQDKLNSEELWLQFWVQLNTAEEKQEYGEFLMAYMQDQKAKGRFNRENLEFGLRNVVEWMEYNEVVSEDNRVLVGISFMFLIVCVANILGLLLAKFLRRAPEVGVRRALGASKRQVFYQHIVEVSMLGLLGGLIGIGIAQLGLWGIRTTYGYYSDLATMDITMYLAAPTIALLASFIAGLYPAWLVCRTTPAIYLKSQ
ncbi:FtsX-like permease family protein [Alteromonas sediminis]|uniref:FtsX-like permease family protein n=1 Tax=Alteromonas sediminis TaxID=2259342 RepID=A0A3N5YAP7_9ALTE|nr:ABC transporter permease [Alteromonas sediminis]RPJ65905.1 FtsX-like permease family protein [Alteromonas sediminis]